jgi:putative endonuclease
MAWVYILQEENNGRYYIGSTVDLKRRLEQHATNHTPTTTRFSLPKLVLSQEYKTLEDARKIERRLKKLKRRDYINQIVQEGNIRMNP